MKGNLEVVQVLCKWDANIHATTSQMYTPLHIASMQGHIGLVRLLLDAKVDPNALDKDKKTAQHFAFQKGHHHIVELLKSKTPTAASPPPERPVELPRAQPVSVVSPREQPKPQPLPAAPISPRKEATSPRAPAKVETKEPVASPPLVQPKPIPAKKEKASVWKGNKKKKASKPIVVPDGIEISWRKPPPPSEVAEAMKFLKPKAKPLSPDAPESAESKASEDAGPAMVSCPFCRGQFADVSEHMDHCPVITGGDAA